ncbi:hypothetical protein, partial [Escherichia coli]
MRRTFTAEEKASVFELWKNGTGFSDLNYGRTEQASVK